MDRRFYLLLRRAAIAGAISAMILVAGFVLYRDRTAIPGSSFGLASKMLIVILALAVGVSFVFYLWRLETTTGGTFADAPRIFGRPTEESREVFDDYAGVVVPMSDGRYPRDQKVPANHTNPIYLAVHGQKVQSQLDMSSTPGRFAGADDDQVQRFEALRSRYPLVEKLCQGGHKHAVELMEIADLTRVEKIDNRNGDGTITHLLVQQAPQLVGLIDHPRGLELVFDPLPGQDLKVWQRAVGKMSTQLGITSLGARQDGVRIVVAFNDKVADLPMNKPLPAPIPAVVSKGKLRSALGQSAYGPAVIQWGNSSGCVVGGVPGSGKTASMIAAFAGLAGIAELHVADGKFGMDLDPLRGICRTYDNLGGYEMGRLYALLKSMKFLLDSRVRAQSIMKATGIANFWDSEPEVRTAAGLYPIFIIIDECQAWFQPGPGLSKESKAACEAVVSIVRELIQRGRSLGIMVILTTQKPDADTIPTVIRDNAALKIAFRVSTREQGRTILGALGPGQESPVDITQDTPGRCIMDVEGQGSNLIQTNYVSPKDIASWLVQFKPVPDQFMQAAGYPLAAAMQAYQDGEEAPLPLINGESEASGHMAVVDDPADMQLPLVRPTAVDIVKDLDDEGI